MAVEKPKKIIPEKATAHITGIIKDAAKIAIGSASISTATLALHNRDTGAEIRAAASITADIDVDGNLDTIVTAAENAMIDQTRTIEIHLATFEITGTAADATTVVINKEVWLQIQNLDQIS